MKNVFIETSRVMAFREAAGVVKDTVKGQPGFMVAWGYAGRGKTECAKEYAVRTPEAVYVRVLEDWTPAAMLSKICYEINGMRPNRVDFAKRAIIEELDRRQMILLIDEADRLVMRNIEHLRDLIEDTGTPIVLIGEPSIYGRLVARNRIKERVKRVVEFGPVTDEDVVYFGMKACDLKILPDSAVELVRRSKGSFRLLYHLMVETERKAKANKLKEVTIDMIESIPDRFIAPTPEKEVR